MDNNEMTPQERAAYIEGELRNFCGTQTWFRHQLFRKFLYTEGIRCLMEIAECYWLIDLIFGFQDEAKVKNAGYFQEWNLTVTDSKATLICENGNSDVVFTYHLAFTDFPLPKIKLFLIRDTLLLPSEY